MSKLSFRARALDASKPMPIFMAEELPDLPEYSAINRAVPQMPSGMEKEEECEHHLQRAICAGLIIPTPEVSNAEEEAYDRLYPPNYKQPRQLIHMQPFTMEQDIPDYDMDSEDERWLVSQAKKLDLTPLKFEEMMDRLEKSSGQTVVTLNEAKALLKEDDDLIIAVFDYWLNKRLKTQHPLILSVKTEHRVGLAANNPYLAFRRRTEKMQTRKNRKNDETSYEKMLKLRRDLSRAVTLLELVKRREKTKREHLHLTIEVFEKRYQAKDYSGSMVAELSTMKSSRPAFTQLFQNHYSNQSWANKAIIKDEIVPRKEKRQYKKRKHKNSSHGRLPIIPGSGAEGIVSSDEEDIIPQQSPEPEETDEEGQFTFRRNKLCTYHMPIPNGVGNWPWCPPEENGLADRRYRYTLTSLAHPRRCIGFARRRLGRGGRVILDRASTSLDDLWRHLDFTVVDTAVQQSSPKSPKSIMEQYMSKTADAKYSLPVTSSDKLVEAKNILNDVTSANSHWPRNNSSSVGLTNGLFNSGSNACEFINSASADVKCEVKSEVFDRTEVNNERFEQDELLEMFREIKRDNWLHFRPKTPPPSKEDSTCNISSLEDSVFSPTSTVPITVELQNLTSDHPSSLLDDSMFTTSSFSLQDLFTDAVDPLVPYDDTRQTPAADAALDRTFGCSRFNVTSGDCWASDLDGDIVSCLNNSAVDVCVTPKKQSILSSTLTSPKYNSVNVMPSLDGWSQQKNIVNHVSNGPLSHSEVATSSRKGNKMQHNAYTSGMSNARGVSTTSTLNSDRNQRLATHTIHTLNSHSANILDITSLSNDSNSDSSKLNSQCVDNTATTNNKQQNNKQPIVRKNNSLVMEVT